MSKSQSSMAQHDEIVQEMAKSKGKTEEKVPDKFYLTSILFVLLGLIHMIPMTFFVTANSYWKYKFRNVSDPTDPTTTTLQSYFSSSCVVAQTVPSVLFTILGTLYGHKIKAVPRLIGSLVVEILAFLLATALVEVNTDSWQTSFFVITMATLGSTSGSNVVFFTSVLAVSSKFPERYLKFFLFGEGTAGIFNGILQIISLSVVTSDIASGLVYFVVGSALLIFTFVLFLVVSRTEHFRYYTTLTEDTQQEAPKFAEIVEIAKCIWPSIVVQFFLFASLQSVHPAVSSLVISENKGTLWGDKYFVPTITFLLADCVSVTGRIVSSNFSLKLPGWAQSLVLFMITFTYVPLVCFCNASPNNRTLPVLFHHDWQYAIILWSFTFLFGYFMNYSMLNLNIYAPKGKNELTFSVMILVLSVISAVTSPFGTVAVTALSSL